MHRICIPHLGVVLCPGPPVLLVHVIISAVRNTHAINDDNCSCVASAIHHLHIVVQIPRPASAIFGTSHRQMLRLPPFAMGCGRLPAVISCGPGRQGALAALAQARPGRSWARQKSRSCFLRPVVTIPTKRPISTHGLSITKGCASFSTCMVVFGRSQQELCRAGIVPDNMWGSLLGRCT